MEVIFRNGKIVISIDPSELPGGNEHRSPKSRLWDVLNVLHEMAMSWANDECRHTTNSHSATDIADFTDKLKGAAIDVVAQSRPPRR